MESASTWKCHDVHLHRPPHLHCDPDAVLVEWDLLDDALGGAVAQSDLEDVLVGVILDTVPTDDALNDVHTEGHHADLEGGLVMVVLEEVVNEKGLEDVTTEEVLDDILAEDVLSDELAKNGLRVVLGKEVLEEVLA